MHNSQRIEQKRLKREKIRREHIASARLRRQADVRRELDQIFEEHQYTFPKEFIPPSDDLDNWGKINWFRSPAKVLSKAREVFGEHPVLKAYYDNTIGMDRAKWDELGLVFTAAAQILCCEPPFFIPYFDFPDLVPRAVFLWARTLKQRNDLWRVIGMPKMAIIDGKEYLVYLSTHFMWRLWARTDLTTNQLVRNRIHLSIFNNLKFEESGLRDVLAVVNTKEGLKSIVGLHQPFGYAPIVKCETHVIAKTFLLPGFEKTPEADWFGEKLRASNLGEMIAKYRGRFEQDGVRSFLGEVEQGKSYLSKSKANFVRSLDEVWLHCRHLYREVKEPTLG